MTLPQQGVDQDAKSVEEMYVSVGTSIARPYGRGVVFLSMGVQYRKRPSFSVRRTRVPKCRTLQKHRFASHLDGIFGKGFGRSKPLPYNYIETLPDNNHYSFFSLQSSVFSNIRPSPTMGFICFAFGWVILGRVRREHSSAETPFSKRERQPFCPLRGHFPYQGNLPLSLRDVSPTGSTPPLHNLTETSRPRNENKKRHMETMCL